MALLRAWPNWVFPHVDKRQAWIGGQGLEVFAFAAPVPVGDFHPVSSSGAGRDTDSNLSQDHRQIFYQGFGQALRNAKWRVEVENTKVGNSENGSEIGSKNK